MIMEIKKFISRQQQALALADFIADAIKRVFTQQDRVCLAVSGGKSPISLFEELSTRKLDWQNITITLVDDRYVDSMSPDSNAHLVKEHLLKNRALAAKFVGICDTSISTHQCIAKAEMEVPAIDIAILGMGEDGHIASIFPCCKELESALAPNPAQRYIVTTPETARYWRIGLNLASILKIPHLVLSLNGANKLAVLNEGATAVNKDLPISLVLAGRADIQIFWSQEGQ